MREREKKKRKKIPCDQCDNLSNNRDQIFKEKKIRAGTFLSLRITIEETKFLKVWISVQQKA